MSNVNLMFLFILVGMVEFGAAVALILAYRYYKGTEANLMEVIQTQRLDIGNFVQFSLAMKASKEVHPSLGPALSKQISELQKNQGLAANQQKQKNKQRNKQRNNEEKQKSNKGVTINPHA